jgi:hypothetical protein
MLEHPEITWALRTGYPSWMQEPEEGRPCFGRGRNREDDWDHDWEEDDDD